jgi:hypothetical protein
MNIININIKNEIDKLSEIKNIDDKIKKIEIIKSEIEKNKNQLKKSMEDIDNATHINNDININLDELKTKFYESNDINEKIYYYQLFANKINLLENELFEN